MTQYLAVIKVQPTDSAVKANFTADDPTEAVKKMCSAVGHSTTTLIYEYELMEVLTGGYRIVAQKVGNSYHPSTNVVAFPSKNTEEKEVTTYSQPSAI